MKFVAASFWMARILTWKCPYFENFLADFETLISNYWKIFLGPPQRSTIFLVSTRSRSKNAGNVSEFCFVTFLFEKILCST
jgi:hypothetical protein